jgi:hypothetical protein
MFQPSFEAACTTTTFQISMWFENDNMFRGTRISDGFCEHFGLPESLALKLDDLGVDHVQDLIVLYRHAPALVLIEPLLNTTEFGIFLSAGMKCIACLPQYRQHVLAPDPPLAIPTPTGSQAAVQAATPMTLKRTTRVAPQTTTSAANQTTTPIITQTTIPAANQTTTPIATQTTTPTYTQTSSPIATQTATSPATLPSSPIATQTNTSSNTQSTLLYDLEDKRMV